MAWKTYDGSPVSPGQCSCTQVCGCNGCCAWLWLWTSWSPSKFSWFGTIWLFSIPQHEKHLFFLQDSYSYTTKNCNVNIIFRNVVCKNVQWNDGWTIVLKENRLMQDPFSPMWTSTRYNVRITGRGLARPPGQNTQRPPVTHSNDVSKLCNVQLNTYGTAKKKCPCYLVGNLVATNWPIEKALHAIGYNQIPTK